MRRRFTLALGKKMSNALPHVVIVGAGFGGLYAAEALAGRPVRVTVIDRMNYHGRGKAHPVQFRPPAARDDRLNNTPIHAARSAKA
jgi:ribulose 1,5-bisphosphate synthetase/thiazole synthase